MFRRTAPDTGPSAINGPGMPLLTRGLNQTCSCLGSDGELLHGVRLDKQNRDLSLTDIVADAKPGDAGVP